MADIPAGLDPTQARVVAEWAHDRPMISCRCDAQGKYIYTCGEEPTLYRFLVADGQKTALPGGHESWVFSVAVTPDGNTLVSGGAEGRLVFWNTSADAPAIQHKVDGHKGWIRALSISPDGTLVASAGNDAIVRLWNVADGTLVREIPGHSRDIYSVIFHPTGGSVISGDLLGQVKQWETATGKEIASFDGKELHSYNGSGQMVDFGGARALVVSPDHQLLLAGGLHKATNPLGAVHEPLVLTFKCDTHELVRQQVAEGITQGVVWRLMYLADGTIMGASGGGNGGFLLFWKQDAEKNFFKFKLPTNIVRDLDLLPDGLRVVTAHYDGKLRVTQLSA